MDRGFANLETEFAGADHYLCIGKPIIRFEVQQFILIAPNDFRFGIDVPNFESEEQTEDSVVHRRNESSIQTIVAYHAIRLRQIEIFQLTFQKTGDYRLGRKLPVTVDDSDERSARGVETHSHIPPHHSLFGTNYRANVL
jgi:hypothetical protein